MTRPLRVGVIGANPNRSWAKDSHIPALRSLENVQLAAVATTSRASADAAAAAFGVRAAYDDPQGASRTKSRRNDCQHKNPQQQSAATTKTVPLCLRRMVSGGTWPPGTWPPDRHHVSRHQE